MKTSVLIGLSRHRIGVDGAGVTTLVAFHGCPLDCKYCLNPQALSSKGVWKKFTSEELYNAVKKDDLYFMNRRSSRAREFHPHPLTEPCVKVSPHTALHTQLFVHRHNLGV